MRSLFTTRSETSVADSMAPCRLSASASAEAHFTWRSTAWLTLHTTEATEANDAPLAQSPSQAGSASTCAICYGGSQQQTTNLAALLQSALDDEQRVAVDCGALASSVDDRRSGRAGHGDQRLRRRWRVTSGTGGGGRAGRKDHAQRNELAEAYSHIEAAQALYHPGNLWGAAVATDLLGGVAWDQGEYARAAAARIQAPMPLQRSAI